MAKGKEVEGISLLPRPPHGRRVAELAFPCSCPWDRLTHIPTIRASSTVLLRQSKDPALPSATAGKAGLVCSHDPGARVPSHTDALGAGSPHPHSQGRLKCAIWGAGPLVKASHQVRGRVSYAQPLDMHAGPGRCPGQGCPHVLCGK